MICAYALGGDGLDGVVDPDADADAFEVVLTDYLGKVWRPALSAARTSPEPR